MSELPKITAYKPHYVELKKNKPYLWCACGLSQKQPYCDGSHRGTDFEPILYRTNTDGEEVLFCACKRTKTAPFCDGSHNNLLDEYDTDDPNSDQNRAIPQIDRDSNGITALDGDCFVADISQLSAQREGNMDVTTVVSDERGAIHQSQLHVSAGDTWSDPVTFGKFDALLFVSKGSGEIDISGERFDIGDLSGIYVRPDEAFAIRSSDESRLNVFVSVCPVGASPVWLADMPRNFDHSQPNRVCKIDDENRCEMADRFFQILVGKDQGCTRGTQFIGEIPFSKATLHRHLYEETLIIVSGEGMMWTSEVKTPVCAGDVIFLPRKEGHSLECLSSGGMLVAGVIYPGDNPSINY